MADQKKKKTQNPQKKIKDAVLNDAGNQTEFNPNHNTRKVALGPNTKR